MNKCFSIAIDGPSGAGKSTLARAVAKKFNFLYLDTGAIYRTVALAALNKNIDSTDSRQVGLILNSINIQIQYSDAGEQRMLLNGEDVSSKIRTPQISILASNVAAHKCVRDFLLATQRNFAENNNVVMDGRDIGTVVLPDAQLKIFLCADAKARAERRCNELISQGIQIDYNEVLQDIIFRDRQDSCRDISPLHPADDAVLLDNGNLSVDDEVETIGILLKERGWKTL